MNRMKGVIYTKLTKEAKLGEAHSYDSAEDRESLIECIKKSGLIVIGEINADGVRVDD